MAISVRELPPLALHVQATTPSGRTQRWGPDERAPENVPQNLSFSTVMPGGNENFSCDLPRMESRAYSDLTLLSNICVRGAGGRIAGEFRLEKAPRATGDQKIVSPQGVGYQAHLADDNTAAEVYVDRDLTHWQGPRRVSGGSISLPFRFDSVRDPSVEPDASTGHTLAGAGGHRGGAAQRADNTRPVTTQGPVPIGSGTSTTNGESPPHADAHPGLGG